MIALLVASTVAMTPAVRPIDWLPVYAGAAASFWGHGQAPVCGAPRFEWSPTLRDAPSDADPATCVIRFNPPDWPRLLANLRWLCITVAHETGHLYGHVHAEGGLMAGDQTVYAYQGAPCDRLVTA